MTDSDGWSRHGAAPGPCLPMAVTEFHCPRDENPTPALKVFTGFNNREGPCMRSFSDA